MNTRDNKWTCRDLDNFTDVEIRELWVAATEHLFNRHGYSYTISVLAMAQNKYMTHAWEEVNAEEAGDVTELFSL